MHRERQDLPDELKPALTPVLDTIAALTLKIQRLATRIERLIQATRVWLLPRQALISC